MNLKGGKNTKTTIKDEGKFSWRKANPKGGSLKNKFVNLFRKGSMVPGEGKSGMGKLWKIFASGEMENTFGK